MNASKMAVVLAALLAAAGGCSRQGSGLEEVLLIGEKVSNTVGFYTPDGRRLGTAEAGKHPHEIVLSHDGVHAYVSDNGILWMTDAGEGGNTISIIDVARRKREGVIDLGQYRRPHGMDIDKRTGRMVVTVENPAGLLLVDPKEKKLLRFFDVKGASPHMVRLGSDGKFAYVSNTASATLAAVDLDTGNVKLIPTDARPQGATLSSDGKLLYLTNSDGNSISIVDTVKNERVGTIETGKGPGRIGLTPDGGTLVYNLQAGSAVGFADVKAGKQVASIDLAGPPLSLQLSADGKRAYAAVQSLDKVYVLSVPDRTIIRVIEGSQGSGPDAVVPIGGVSD
jgi:YVTN family beta-propeller protein